MNIICNEKGMSVEAQTTLFYVLEQTGFHNQTGIAIAVNNCVIPRTKWESHELLEGDKILVIQATKGG